MNDEKVYINSMTFKEYTFDNGGSIINVGINVEKIIEELGQFKNDKGYMNISISKRKEPGKYGHTHYAILNTYKKDDSQGCDTTVSPSTMPDDDIPF